MPHRAFVIDQFDDSGEAVRKRWWNATVAVLAEFNEFSDQIRWAWNPWMKRRKYRARTRTSVVCIALRFKRPASNKYIFPRSYLGSNLRSSKSGKWSRLWRPWMISWTRFQTMWSGTKFLFQNCRWHRCKGRFRWFYQIMKLYVRFAAKAISKRLRENVSILWS